MDSTDTRTRARHAAAGADGTAPRNPLLQPSELPFELPDFAAVTPELLRDALDEGMELEVEAWEDILDTPEASNVENLVEALAHAQAPLMRAVTILSTLASSVGEQAYLDLEAEYLPLLAMHGDRFWLEPAMYYRFQSLERAQPLLELPPDIAHYVRKTAQRFRFGGIELDDLHRGALGDLNAHLAGLEADFGQRVTRASLAYAVDVDGEGPLAGLDEDTLAALRTDPGRGAHARTKPGQHGAGDDAAGEPLNHYVLPLLNTTQQPLAGVLRDAEVRADLLHASTSRCGQVAFGEQPPALSPHAGGDIISDTDTRSTLLEIVRLRAARAQVLGFADHASFIAAANDAGTTEAIDGLLERIAAPARAQVDAEIAELNAAGGGPITPADVLYRYEQRRKATTQADDEHLRPYLELWSVIEKGVFYAAERLFGITFTERPDLPAYAEDVRVWEVREADGETLGLFVGDFYARPGKQGGAWMHELVPQSRLFGTLPVICNNANFRKPTEGKPTLLTWDEVRTCFHEFGHALHGLLSDVYLPQQSGTAVQRDTVEFPSQVNEMWQAHPQVLANYARHWQTGEPMPQELVESLRAAERVSRGFAMTEHVAAVVLDQGWHRLKPEDVPDDPAEVDHVEQQILASAGLDHPLIPPRYRSSYFRHTFAGGYDAGYYSYLWAEQLDADAVDWFETIAARDGDGGLNRQAGDRYRAEVLSRGGTRDMSASFHALRGRDTMPEPLLERHGLLAHE